MENPKENKLSLWILLLIVFIDLLGVGIIIPILPVVFFETNILASSPMAVKTFLLGLLIAAYPIAQFFGAPLLGSLSDRMGRKPVLLISLLGTFFGYILFALGLMISDIYLLFLARILDGFTGGNISVARSAIADTSTEKTKVKNFGLIGVAFGLGFIFGPFVGGKLTDSQMVSWFNITTPFWFAAILVAFNLLFVIWKFKETLKKKTERKVNAFSGFVNIGNAFKMHDLRSVFITLFLMFFGWSFFTQFFQIYLYDKFKYTPADIGTTFAYMGIWIVIAQGVVTRSLSSRVKPRKVLEFSLLFTSIMLFILLIPNNHIYLWFIIPFISIFNGLTMPNISAVISDSVGETKQGEVMGIQQSLISAAQAIPPIIAGISIAFSSYIPIVLGGLFIFLSWVVYTFCCKNNLKKMKDQSQ